VALRRRRSTIATQGESARARAGVSGACGARSAGKSERHLRATRAERGDRSFCLCEWFNAFDENRASERSKQSITTYKMQVSEVQFLYFDSFG
jgi:hypothetical protein